ncbi:hypothetical protein ACFL23_00265 [Patescibacteria group bacterium]
MLSTEQLKIISNFLSDSAKIIFGSMVIGIFVPSASGETPWATFIMGLTLTIAFLISAIILSKPSKKTL